MPRHLIKIERVCLNCGKSFLIPHCWFVEGRGKYCSKSCYSSYPNAQTSIDPVIRFWEKVNKTETCWLWTAGLTAKGYGSFRTKSGAVLAHRFAYELIVGPIPDGLELDHVKARGCTNKHCVNPAHLEAVTHQANMLRSDAPPAHNVHKTHCKFGHEFSAGNTYMTPTGKRYCRACGRESTRQYQIRKLARTG